MAKLPKIMLIGIIIINLLTPFVTVSAEGQVSTPLLNIMPQVPVRIVIASVRVKPTQKK